ncbi:hypothetical protein [Streptomyces venezuelae]|uniref:hypothetical protein n=1 Tax=Streptomyces venezuelae TaxID=54571 RepID=UPI003316A78A
MAATTAKVERLRLKVRELEAAEAAAAKVGEDGEKAAADALADRDAFEKERLAPAHSSGQRRRPWGSAGMSLSSSGKPRTLTTLEARKPGSDGGGSARAAPVAA